MMLSLIILQQKTQNAAGAIVGKPKDIAIKFKNKFGSVDNLANYKEDGEDAEGGCESSFLTVFCYLNEWKSQP